MFLYYIKYSVLPLYLCIGTLKHTFVWKKFEELFFQAATATPPLPPLPPATFGPSFVLLVPDSLANCWIIAVVPFATVVVRIVVVVWQLFHFSTSPSRFPKQIFPTFCLFFAIYLYDHAMYWSLLPTPFVSIRFLCLWLVFYFIYWIFTLFDIFSIFFPLTFCIFLEIFVCCTIEVAAKIEKSRKKKTKQSNLQHSYKVSGKCLNEVCEVVALGEIKGLLREIHIYFIYIFYTN